MANIQIAGLYEQKRREFTVMGNTLPRFQQDFVDALNRAARRINRQCNLSTRITNITAPEGEFALSDEYTDVVSDLVTIQLMEMGQHPSAKDGAEFWLKKSATMDNRIDDIRQDICTQAIDADTDDESDFVGLGGLGD